MFGLQSREAWNHFLTAFYVLYHQEQVGIEGLQSVKYGISFRLPSYQYVLFD